MRYVISRPPTDIFSYELFTTLTNELTCDYDAYYMWATPPDMLINFLTHANFGSAPNVILGIKDLLDLWQDYNYWHQTAQAGTKFIDATAQRWPDTNFVLLTSLENLQNETIQASNLQIVPWGGDWVNQHVEYQNLEPVLNKNFSSKRHYISLNRNPRDHRLVYLSYLFGLDLDQHGEVSYLNISNINKMLEPDNFLDRLFWEFDIPKHDRIREVMLKGYPRFYNDQRLVADDYDIYGKNGINDNIKNFNRDLRSKYQNSFLEIVTESSFTSPGYMLTEKTMHAFYGCNFPIFLFGQGGVQHLRDLGFDVFDDIVDHSYDMVKNPFDRITTAIDNNVHLLSDGQLVKQLWQANQPRFVKNIDTAKNITIYYQGRVEKLWKNLHWNK